MQVTTASEAELALQERANEGLSRDVERFEKKEELEKEARTSSTLPHAKSNPVRLKEIFSKSGAFRWHCCRGLGCRIVLLFWPL